MIKKYILIILMLPLLILNCSNEKESINKDNIDQFKSTPELIYKLAMTEFNNENYEIAEQNFNNIILKFPLSNEAIQSQIMLAFIEYVKLNYDEAIFQLTKIINNYPSHKNIDYTYYLRAISYYEQIENESLDGFKNLKALKSFNEIINRFPDSKYLNDSKQKIIFIKENIAAKHMNIGLFYTKQKKYNAAINRFKKVVEFHPTSKFVPEALYRLVEIYYNLGLADDAKKTAAVIGYNYPKSQWYKYSYELLYPNSKNKNFLDKISNLLNKNDKKEK